MRIKFCAQKKHLLLLRLNLQPSFTKKPSTEMAEGWRAFLVIF